MVSEVDECGYADPETPWTMANMILCVRKVWAWKFERESHILPFEMGAVATLFWKPSSYQLITIETKKVTTAESRHGKIGRFWSKCVLFRLVFGFRNWFSCLFSWCGCLYSNKTIHLLAISRQLCVSCWRVRWLCNWGNTEQKHLCKLPRGYRYALNLHVCWIWKIIVYKTSLWRLEVKKTILTCQKWV